MKIRTGFVSNSSSSSFIITGKDNIEKAKYIIDNAQDIYGDYYEVNDKLFTSGISGIFPIADSKVIPFLVFSAIDFL